MKLFIVFISAELTELHCDREEFLAQNFILPLPLCKKKRTANKLTLELPRFAPT